MEYEPRQLISNPSFSWHNQLEIRLVKKDDEFMYKPGNFGRKFTALYSPLSRVPPLLNQQCQRLLSIVDNSHIGNVYTIVYWENQRKMAGDLLIVEIFQPYYHKFNNNRWFINANVDFDSVKFFWFAVENMNYNEKLVY